MLFQPKYPTDIQLDALVSDQKDKPLSYPKIHDANATMAQKTPNGYRYDSHQFILGQGEAVFQAACEAVREWQMFPYGWANLYKRDTPIEIGRVVVMCARIWGFWWLNCSRIVFTVNDAHSFGFAYGTLKHHAESGEELFQVRMTSEGEVLYEIQAFSRPRFWMARLAFPVARHFQRKFVKESFENMKKVVDEKCAKQLV
jgi:uncharacterized protein (UPF0548 family)